MTSARIDMTAMKTSRTTGKIIGTGVRITATAEKIFRTEKKILKAGLSGTIPTDPVRIVRVLNF